MCKERKTGDTPENDPRILRNFLSATAGDQINTLLVAKAYNIQKWMRLEKQRILDLIYGWIYRSLILVPVKFIATE